MFPVTRPGWSGWDEYAPFYDWENAQTLGRKDVAFWRQVARRTRGPLLELGCGTGRITMPLARSGAAIVGLDRSAPMLAHAARRLAAWKRRRVRHTRSRAALVRGDVRSLPFPDAHFAAVLAPYGVLQSLTSDRDLAAALRSAARVVRPGGLFGIDLVPDVPNWREYRNRTQLRGWAAGGVHLQLIESVRQDRRRHRTVFEQTYVRRKGRDVSRHRFQLTFRTLPLKGMIARLERAGFAVDAVLGDYRGGAWDERADVWVILARRRS